MAVILASAAAAACIMGVEYARPGAAHVPPAGKALVFTRVRFFEEGFEYFPWGAPSIGEVFLNVDRERHIWLRRLDRNAASMELQPDTNGSLAIWLPPGDYALLGLEGELSATLPAPVPEMVALLRVPAGQPLVYAGELTFTEIRREGWHGRYTFGESSVTIESVAATTEVLEARYGALPGPPAVSAWCSGDRGSELPRARDPDLLRKARQLLDADCPALSAQPGR